jgi:hypothetical protein
MRGFSEKERKRMSRTESEEMREIFVDDKLHRRILELLETGKSDEEIVGMLIGEMDQ